VSKWVAGAIRIDGIDEVVRELERRKVDVVRGVEAICDAGAQVVQGAIALRAPGRLAAATVRETSVRAGTRVTVSVGPERKVNYIARFVEFGTKAHAIAPRSRKRGRRRALSVPGYGVFRSVNHPGGRKRPYIRPGFEASKMGAQEAMRVKTKSVVRA
jgi:hypothetical protein